MTKRQKQNEHQRTTVHRAMVDLCNQFPVRYFSVEDGTLGNNPIFPSNPLYDRAPFESRIVLNPPD